jgi:hypothetical protein
MLREFESTPRELRYEVNETELRKKINEMLLQAIVNGHMDGGFSEVQEELCSDVWFVIKPGLAKWGTGTGQNLDKSTVLLKPFVELIN